MAALKIAIQLASLRLPFREAIGVAASLGASGVEIDARGEVRPADVTQTALREVRRLLSEAGLSVASVGFHTRRGYDTADAIEGRVAATKAAMKFAAQLGAAVVINEIGHIPAESNGHQWELLLAALSDLGNYGHHVGATLAAQTGANSPADLARLIAALPPQAVAVDIDPGNLIIHGFSPREAVETLGSHILHVHARDGVRDLARGRGLEVSLGRGTADFPALLGALEERQYRGFFTIARHEAENPQLEIGEAVKYLKSL